MCNLGQRVCVAGRREPQATQKGSQFSGAVTYLKLDSPEHHTCTLEVGKQFFGTRRVSRQIYSCTPSFGCKL